MVSQLIVPHPYESRLSDSTLYPRLQRLARKYTRGTSIAWEDALQSAQIKILQAMRSGKFRQGGLPEFDRWAFTVARFEIIDLVRREKWHYTSLDAVIPGTDLAVSETIADEFNGLEILERTDLVTGAIAAISELHQRDPDREYLALWQGQLQGKTQTQLARQLGLSQGEVSKRWKELIYKLTVVLELVSVEAVQQEQTTQKRKRGRPRAIAQW